LTLAVARALLAGLLLGVGLAASVAAAPEPAAAILGNWLTEPRDGIIRITVSPSGLYEGRIVGGNAPQRLDTHNPDPARRQQLLLGQLIMKGLRYSSGNVWSGGTIYDPDSGHTYRCHMEFGSDGSLRVRGYFGLALLGRTQQWTRYFGSSVTLPALAP